MIEDYMGARAFTAGQRVVIPKRPWNPSGVEPTGYQLVPILVYHNLGPQSKGRLVLGVEAFAEQMRYLGREGYRVVTLAEFVEWLQLRRQLPRKSVVLTFDDGYRSFREHAYPVLKELGFPATLFVYTDYVGASRNALAWEDLRSLVAEGFDVQAHSKTHGDLRRAAGETDAQYARRMQAELADPPKLFQRQLGRGVPFLAYPYGRVDEGLLARVREQGYTAAFTVRRESNASFVRPLQISRSQIYSEMTLEQFARNLDLFHAEDLR
jgi:peptidoglycan/xylan/chitin deacetylase (PgdA/CDA1 family)